jgi:ubiquinone/menaquinone biosynthesis C-methylase UbiE
VSFRKEVAQLSSDVVDHYGETGHLAARIRSAFISAGKDVERLVPADMGTLDELHIRGREATLELAERMELGPESHALDVGSGIGGTARTLADLFDCRVTGIDVTRSYCETAAEISGWFRLGDRARFVLGDATNLPFAPASFDAAITIHVAMNIPNKAAIYAGTKRVLRQGGIFAIYDVLQGEGGPVLYPMPWALEASASHLATPAEMRRLLTEAGFTIVEERDSTEESVSWIQERGRMMQSSPTMLTPALVIGAFVPAMNFNVIRNVAEKRVRTVTYICRA